MERHYSHNLSQSLISPCSLSTFYLLTRNSPDPERLQDGGIPSNNVSLSLYSFLWIFARSLPNDPWWDDLLTFDDRVFPPLDRE